jgi:hypothetical protein
MKPEPMEQRSACACPARARAILGRLQAKVAGADQSAEPPARGRRRRLVLHVEVVQQPGRGSDSAAT